MGRVRRRMLAEARAPEPRGPFTLYSRFSPEQRIPITIRYMYRHGLMQL